MSNQPSKINERSEALVVCQFLDAFGVPMLASAFDSVLFSLHDSAGTIINGQTEIEVLGENGGSFIESYAISEVTTNRHEVFVGTTLPNVIRPSWIVMPSGIGDGTGLPNGRPMSALPIGTGRISLPHHTSDTWGTISGSSVLRVGAFTLALTPDDTQIVAPAPEIGKYQDRTILLTRLLDGVVVGNDPIKLQILNLAVIS